LETSEWKKLEHLVSPPARSVTDVVHLPGLGNAGSLFVFGGEFTPSSQGHEGAGTYRDDSWVYDLESNKWIEYKNQENDVIPTARGWFSSCALQDGASVLIFGGFDGTGRLDDSYIWTPRRE